jgi:hypothetical protein
MSATLMNRSFDGQNPVGRLNSKSEKIDEEPFFFQRWRGPRVEQ